MGLTTTLVKDLASQELNDITVTEFEDKQVPVVAGILNYCTMVPSAFENTDLTQLNENTIIGELVPQTAAALVILDMLGEDAAEELRAEIRCQVDAISDLPHDAAAALFDDKPESEDDGENDED